MAKTIKTTIEKINFLLLFACCVGYSSTLYAVENTPVSWEVDSTCTSIKGCKALTTIISCLQYWQKANNDGNLRNILTHLNADNNYMHIVSAYHHLLDKHLNSKHHKAHYSFVHKEACKAVHCNFNTCLAYTRNQRERGKEPHKAASDDDKAYIFLRDFLDTMHAYLRHGYDSGHRYLGDMGDNIKANNEYFFDLEVVTFKKWQAHIKKQQRNQNRNDIFQTKTDALKPNNPDKKISLDILNQKFSNEPLFAIWTAYLRQNECDTDNILQQIEKGGDDTEVMYYSFQLDKKAKTIFFDKIKAYIQAQRRKANEKTSTYNFGVRLYYWDDYKNNKYEDTTYNPGYLFEELCVSPCYTSFKQEILAKGIPIGAWQQKMYEATTILRQSNTIKKLKAARYEAVYPYDLLRGTPISASHILSILFYTHFTTLCTEFSESFGYLSSSESLPALLKRAAKWYYLSKYLREAVEVFGTKIDGTDEYGRSIPGLAISGDMYYHGISCLPSSAFNVRFYGPLSTSKQLEVATLFADKEGVIVDLKQSDVDLRFFNVSLLSCFSSEDERLFIGGYRPLQISSIRLLKDNMNTGPLMHALSVFHSMIKGEKINKKELTTLDIAIFNNLVSFSPKIPLYAQQIWVQFKNRLQTVKINMHLMDTCYALFRPNFTASNPVNLLSFDKIVAILPNVTTITSQRTGLHADCPVSSAYIVGLKDSLSKIGLHKSSQLQKIIISTSKACEIDDNLNLNTKAFDELGWNIGKEENDDGECFTIVVTKQ